jgi:hypothetical protein
MPKVARYRYVDLTATTNLQHSRSKLNFNTENQMIIVKYIMFWYPKVTGKNHALSVTYPAGNMYVLTISRQRNDYNLLGWSQVLFINASTRFSQHKKVLFLGSSMDFNLVLARNEFLKLEFCESHNTGPSFGFVIKLQSKTNMT